MFFFCDTYICNTASESFQKAKAEAQAKVGGNFMFVFNSDCDESSEECFIPAPPSTTSQPLVQSIFDLMDPIGTSTMAPTLAPEV